MYQSAACTLTTRDQEVLVFIGTLGLATVRQVRAYGWAGATLDTTGARLRQLERAGYLALGYSYPHGTRQRVAWLTAAGRAALPAGRRGPLHTGLPRPSAHAEILLLQDARLRLECLLRTTGGRLVAFIDERALRADYSRIVALTKTTNAPAPARSSADALALVTTSAAPAARLEPWHLEADGGYYGRQLAAKGPLLAGLEGQRIYACRPRRLPTVAATLAAYPQITIWVLEEELP